jgi:hypothetical protein
MEQAQASPEEGYSLEEGWSLEERWSFSRRNNATAALSTAPLMLQHQQHQSWQVAATRFRQQSNRPVA